MLDYKVLSKKFDELLTKTTKEDLESWIKFDQKREIYERLRKGKSIEFLD
jgi:hypothetical protein